MVSLCLPVVFQCVPTMQISVLYGVLTASELEAIRSGNFSARHPLCIQLVWRELFELIISWYHARGDVEVLKRLKSKTGIHCQAETPSKSWIYRDLSTRGWWPTILSFKTGMDATLLSYMSLGVRGLLQSIHWCSSVGCNSQILFSGIPVWGSLNYVFQWCSSVPCKYSLGRPVASQCTLGQPVAFQCHSSVHWTSRCTLAQVREFIVI